MAKRSESAEQLRDRILVAMQKDIGISETMALPFVDSVMRCFAGERAYFPAIERSYSVSEIAQALSRGVPIAKVARDAGISRRQVYRILQASGAAAR